MLEAFDELGVKPSIIAGTSIGSICGAAFAAGLSAAEIRAEFEGLLRNRATFFGRVAGALRGELATLLEPARAQRDRQHHAVRDPAARAPASRLRLARRFPSSPSPPTSTASSRCVLEHGPLIPALAASCSLPGLSRPVVLEGRLLIDGGYINPVPYDVVMDRADITVAVDVTGDPRRRPDARAPKTFDLLTGATQILFHSITREKLKSVAPDIFIRPAVGGFAAMDYFHIGRDPGRRRGRQAGPASASSPRCWKRA